jgi:hypothetical protein
VFYQGYLKRKKPHGIGKVLVRSGTDFLAFYEGEFSNGEITGFGRTFDTRKCIF